MAQLPITNTPAPGPNHPRRICLMRSIGPPNVCIWFYRSAAVTAVKDQGLCTGASHAFAAVEAIESARYISSGKLVDLSAQQLIDCTIEMGNKGCISGNASISYGYLSRAGVASEKKYPYKGFAYNCIYSLSMKET